MHKDLIMSPSEFIRALYLSDNKWLGIFQRKLPSIYRRVLENNLVINEDIANDLGNVTLKSKRSWLLLQELYDKKIETEEAITRMKKYAHDTEVQFKRNLKVKFPNETFDKVK